MSTPPPPYNRSWWVLPSKLLASCYPGDIDPKTAESKFQSLKKSGVKAIINLQEPHEIGYHKKKFPFYYPSVKDWCPLFVRVPVRDHSFPSLFSIHLIHILLHKLESLNQTSMVHCWGGHGRTGLICASFLLSKFKPLPSQQYIDQTNIIKFIHSLRSHDNHLKSVKSPQTSGQIDYVTHWKHLSKSIDSIAQSPPWMKNKTWDSGISSFARKISSNLYLGKRNVSKMLIAARSGISVFICVDDDSQFPFLEYYPFFTQRFHSNGVEREFQTCLTLNGDHWQKTLTFIVKKFPNIGFYILSHFPIQMEKILIKLFNVKNDSTSFKSYGKPFRQTSGYFKL